MNKKLASLLSLSTMTMVGCSTANKIPDNIDERIEEQNNNDQLIEDWRNREPAMTVINTGSPVIFKKPKGIPKEIYDLNLETQVSGESTLADLAAIISPLDIFLSFGDEELKVQPLTFFEYKGNLGDYLTALESVYDISFNWLPGNVLSVDQKAQYVVYIPQNEDIASAIKANLLQLGADAVSYSIEGSIMSYKATSSDQDVIAEFLHNISENSALVSMQVAVINVALDSHEKSGIDWSQLNFGIGEAAVSKNLGGIDIDDDDDDDDDDDNDDDDNNIVDDYDSASGSGYNIASVRSLMMKGGGIGDLQMMSQVGGGGSSLLVANKNISISAVLDYLNTYGETKTTQSVLMKTISGKEVKLKSATQIPYMDNVGVSNLLSSDGGNNIGLGTASVKNADVGLDLKLQPFFHAKNEMITINVDMNLSALTNWVQLSAGNQIGSITQPQIQKQEFNDIVKMRAGDTVIIGGITYLQARDNRNSPTFLKDVGGAHVDKNLQRTAMVIMIRPSVTAFKAIKTDKIVISR